MKNSIEVKFSVKKPAAIMYAENQQGRIARMWVRKSERQDIAVLWRV